MSGLEALGLAANVIAVVDLSAKVISWCYKYSNDVKNAKTDIERLQQETQNLQIVAEALSNLLEGPNAAKFATSSKLLGTTVRSRSLLRGIDETLGEKKGLRRFGLRALKWPYKSEDVERLVDEIRGSHAILHEGLQIDQLNIVLGIDERAKLDRIPVAEGASSHAGDDDATTCLPNTRVQLLDDIRRWVHDSDSKSIMWLGGNAGTGKSTISLTLAREFEKSGILGASFFFKRTQKDRSELSKFVSTLAADMAIKVPEAGRHILDVLEKDGKVFQKIVGEQLDHLVIEPLVKCKLNQPIVIIIDALDECKREADMRSLIQLLTRAKVAEVSNLRIFLTSRPELPIRLGFRLADSKYFQSVTLHDIPEATIESDILTFLEFHLGRIREEYNASELSQNRALDPGWPEKEKISTLRDMSVPLFIFAATVCRFIGDHAFGHPDKQLQDVLKFGTKSQDAQPQLDKTYLPVLDRLVAGRSNKQCIQIWERFRSIVGSILLIATPLSKTTLAKLLGIDRDVIDHLLESLHSVIKIPSSPSEPLRLYHLSFRDFLIDSDKSESSFWIDEKQVHTRLALRSLVILTNNLKQNICGIADRSMPRKEYLETVQLDSILSPELRYACTYWVHHFESAGSILVNDGLVFAFLRTHFLHWLELMSLLGKAYECIFHIDTLQRLSCPTNGTLLSLFLQDARYFIHADPRAIDTFPLQLYSSLLAFAPTKSMVRRLFESTMAEWVRVRTSQETDWSDCLQTFDAAYEGKVAFSPDSAFIAVSSKINLALQIWNAVTGEVVRNIHFGPGKHGQPVFSPDSSHILLTPVTMGDCPSLIWNIGTGEPIQDFEDLLPDQDSSSMFSPTTVHIDNCLDGGAGIWRVKAGAKHFVGKIDSSALTWAHHVGSKIIAFADFDSLVTIWDLDSGNLICSWRVPNEVVAMALSHDSKVLAVTASIRGQAYDEVVMYCVNSGQPLHTFTPDAGWVRDVVFSLDSSLLAIGEAQGRVSLWRADTFECLQVFIHHDSIRNIALSHDSSLLASTAAGGRIRIWRVRAETQERNNTTYTSEEAPRGMFPGILASPELSRVAILNDDTVLQMWDTAVGEIMWTSAAKFERCSFLSFSPNSVFVTLATDEDLPSEEAMSIRVETGQRLHLEGQTKADEKPVFNNDSTLLALSRKDGLAEEVRIWDTSTGKCVQCLEYPDNGWRYRAFSEDSRLIGSFCGTKVSIRSTRDAENQKVVTLSSNNLNFPGLAVFSPKLELIAVLFEQDDWSLGSDRSSDSDGPIGSDMSNREHEDEKQGSNEEHNSDGSNFGGRLHGYVRVWRCDTGKVVQTLEGNVYPTNDMMFIHNGDYLVKTQDQYRPTSVWDVRTGALLHNVPLPDHFGGPLHYQPESSLLLTRNGAVELINFPSATTSLPHSPTSSQSSNAEEHDKTITCRRSGFGIKSDNTWITHGENDFFYLPINYQPDGWTETCFVFGCMVMIRYRSGRFVLFNFSATSQGGTPILDIV